MQGLEIEDDKSWKGKQRSVSGVATGAAAKKRVRGPRGTTANGRASSSGVSSRCWASVIPTSVTCDPVEASSHPGAVECGVVVSALILGLFFFGFYEASNALPQIPFERAWRAHPGENLNLARDEWTSPLLEQHHRHLDVASNRTYLPSATWPMSIRNEDQHFEILIHPGDNRTEMSVPKFWSPPVHRNGLMSRDTAMKIGTCNEPDPVTGSYTRGDACPIEQRTIFIAIASYRDFECRSTVESAFLSARYPQRVRVGVVDQIVNGEDVICDDPIQSCDEKPEQALCKYRDRVDVYEMEAELSIGPVFARHIGYRMYRGEYYATQSDAHVTFSRGWDVDIIEQFESTKNEMAVLSTYLTDIQGSLDENGDSLRNTRPIMCNTVYEGGPQGMHLRHAAQPERKPTIHGVPQLQPWWAAGYSFSRGHFVVNVPYDYLQPMIFQGEEMSIGIRGFTIGYDYYAPERSVCFHHYAVGANLKKRSKVHHFWENDSKYAGTGRRAMQRLLGIVHMNPEVNADRWSHMDIETYGIGGVRAPEKFYETFGIDVVKKKIEANLCCFVHEGGKMHKMFTPHLRDDGMGIDYSLIDYKFVNPFPGQKLY